MVYIFKIIIRAFVALLFLKVAIQCKLGIKQPLIKEL
jgi:hypothetical protein